MRQRDNTTVNEDLNRRVREVITKTFGLLADDAQRDLRLGSVPRWDSLGHMELVVELESAFQVRFPTYALAQLVDVEAIVRAIEEQRSQASG